jgi:hypothetical protein
MAVPLTLEFMFPKMSAFEMQNEDNILRAALHLEAGPISLEADCMKFQPFFGLEVGLNYTL